jgi:hypothetical protein
MALSQSLKQALECFRAGPLRLVVDPGGADEVELLLSDGLRPRYQRGREAVEVEGVGVVDVAATGDSALFELALDEVSLEACKVLFRDQAVDEQAATLGWGLTPGSSLIASARHFRFLPLQDASEVQWDFWKVLPEGELVQELNDKEPWRTVQSFRAYPDLTQAEGERVALLAITARS